MNVIEVKNLSKKFTGSNQYAVSNCSFDIAKGELVALIGESGSGKSTVLRMIAGLEMPNDGEILLYKRSIYKGSKSVPPHQRGIGMVFQDYALFPHLNLHQNIAFGIAHLNKTEQNMRVEELLELVNLQEDTNKYPHQLSGGQQQRVALARALAPSPDIILLDEPFSNLDAKIKEQISDEIGSILKKIKASAIWVTHDMYDAIAIADRILIMHQGQLLFSGSPQAAYNCLNIPQVASLFGRYNTICFKKENDGSFSSEWGVVSQSQMTHHLTEDYQLHFRPEKVVIRKNEKGNFKGKIIQISYLGAYWSIKLSAINNQNKTIITAHVNTLECLKLEEYVFFDIVTI